MKIEIIENAGFCYGVQKAYDTALENINSNSKKKIYSLGELIHNHQVIEELSNKGIETIKDIDNVKGKNSAVIIRAHGVPKTVMERIKEKNIKSIDATCPYVKIPQNAVKDYTKKGYFIIIVGDNGHPEVIGIKSYAEEGRYIVTKSIDDLPSKKLRKLKKVVLVSQTTLSFETLNKIVSHVLQYIQELVVINSICDATDIRQRETRELAKRSDIMIVIGGKHSSNTTRLKEIASKYCKTYHIELESEIKKEWFDDKKSVGISAGASTPDWIINRVFKHISSI